MPSMRRTLAALTLILTPPLAAEVPPRALELHQLGYAELENEKPENAEAPYREVVRLVPGEALGYANLAIALLRQQKYEPALRVLDVVPEERRDDPGLLAVRADVLQWTGDLAGALDVLERAAAAAPRDLEILYAAYQLASSLEGEKADAVARRSLERLAELRPENVVVLLQLAHRAVARGDRAAATRAVGRLGELLWQAPEMAERALEMASEALKQDDLAQARGPVLRFENVLKVTPMFRESLRELKTGIQGIPYARFEDQPPPTAFGEPRAVSFSGARLDERPAAGRALAAADFDGDLKPDLARVRADGTLEVRLAAGGWKVTAEQAAPGLDELLAADLDNDGHLDLLAFGAAGAAVWLGKGDGSFAPAPDQLGLATAGAAAAAVIDFDVEGDLDLALAGRAAGAADLWRNALQGPLERLGERSLPRLALQDARAVAASDLDRDGDLDLVVAHAKGLTRLDNLRQGEFTDLGVIPAPWAVAAAASADLDNDGLPDLVGAGRGLAAWRNRGGKFEPWTPAGLPASAELTSVVAFDADNDGRLDLAAAGPGGVIVLLQQAAGGFKAAELADAPKTAAAVLAADLDADGDLDLAVAGGAGLHWLENEGGNRHHWLAVRLRGLDKGNSKNNVFGAGAVVEVRNGQAYQFREAAGDVVHFGLGSQERAEILRVVWTNGVPQNRLAVAGDQRIVEEQLLKGSCPFLYAWDGERFAFVTDLLWAAPLGLPVAPGAYASADPSELVRVDGLAADGGVYRLRLTEELWEAAFFDHVRLWVVDHPPSSEVASNLRVVPGEALPERVLASRGLRPVAAAWDGRGREVTREVRLRDDVYADGYTESRYQGVASVPWTFTFDLGEAPGGPVRLHLDGWIFPADASLNLAVAQRDDLPYLPPRLEVETAEGWETLIESVGHPAGKTKTMVIDTPPLPPGARKLRLVTSLWLHWDRIAWTTTPADGDARVMARLTPSSAVLRYRGFSAMERRAPNAPHVFDYERVRLDSPWLPFPGRYTRYGDAAKLLAEADDFSAILAPGDEIALEFDARDLPPPSPGFVRTLFLESHGWDKDADRNTYEGHRLEPLPFRAMNAYPFTYPETPAHREYRREWLTREVE